MINAIQISYLLYQKHHQIKFYLYAMIGMIFHFEFYKKKKKKKLQLATYRTRQQVEVGMGLGRSLINTPLI